MKPLRFFCVCLLVAASGIAAESTPAPDKNFTDAIDIVRTIYQTDRQTFVSDKLQLTEREAAGFWPLYESYRADMEKIGDDLIKLVLEYADAYPQVSEDRAGRLLKEYTRLEKKLVDKRVWYRKRASRILPAAKVLCWTQLEHRMDLVLQLQLASAIPVVKAIENKP